MGQDARSIHSLAEQIKRRGLCYFNRDKFSDAVFRIREADELSARRSADIVALTLARVIVHKDTLGAIEIGEVFL